MPTTRPPQEVPLLRWLVHVLGLDSASGGWYLWWSGVAGDLGYLAAVGVIWHHMNCHEAGCWRFARHHGGGRCRKHGL